MKRISEFVNQYYKTIIIVLILIFSGYLIVTVITSIDNFNFVQLIKDIVGLLAMGVSISFAFTINVNLNRYEADNQYFVKGDLHKHEAGVKEDPDLNDMKDAIKTINSIVFDSNKLVDGLSFKGEKTGMFIPYVTQRDRVYNLGKFTNQNNIFIKKLCDVRDVIKNDEFVKILNLTIKMSEGIGNDFVALKRNSNMAINNGFNQARLKCIKDINEKIESLKGFVTELKKLL